MTYKELLKMKLEVDRETNDAITDLLKNHFEGKTACLMDYFHPELMPDEDTEEWQGWNYEDAYELPFITYYKENRYGCSTQTSKCAQVYLESLGNVWFEVEDDADVSCEDVDINSRMNILYVLERMIEHNKTNH